jgi:hypothetical protein
MEAKCSAILQRKSFMQALVDGMPMASRDELEFICTLSINQLMLQPQHLSRELNTATTTINTLVKEHEDQLRQQHTLAKQATRTLHALKTSIDTANTKADEFGASCMAFQQKANALQAAKQPAHLILSKRHDIVNLCEIPRVASTLARSNRHPDTAMLIAHLQRLSRLHPDVTLLQDLVVHAERVQEEQKRRLLAELSDKLTLAQFLALVGHLKQTAQFKGGETELVHAVFSVRVEYVNHVWSQVVDDKFQPCKQLRQAAEVWRDRVYEVTRQLRSGFPSHVFMIRDAVVHITSRMEKEYRRVLLGTGEFPLIKYEEDGSGLNALHTQAGQIAMALAPLGIDCGALIGNVFYEAAVQLFSTRLQNGLEALRQALQQLDKTTLQHTWPGLVQEQDVQGGVETTLPTDLMQHRPLAAFCNACLVALNALRLCAPRTAAHVCATALHTTLVDASMEWWTVVQPYPYADQVVAVWLQLVRYLRHGFSKIYGKQDWPLDTMWPWMQIDTAVETQVVEEEVEETPLVF